MAKYRKKPVVIEAFRLGHNDWPDWFDAAIRHGLVALRPHEGASFRKSVLIETLEGFMRAEDGDYVIRGVKGELYPCKADIFEATYERVGD